jgi:hypothetical protein
MSAQTGTMSAKPRVGRVWLALAAIAFSVIVVITLLDIRAGSTSPTTPRAFTTQPQPSGPATGLHLVCARCAP